MQAGRHGLGGVAAHWAQQLDQRLIKGFVTMLGTTLTICFLWRGI